MQRVGQHVCNGTFHVRPNQIQYDPNQPITLEVVDILDGVVRYLLTMPLPGRRNRIQPCGGRIMWAALLTVAALSLLISSALAAIATYLYFFGSSESAQKGFPSIAPDEAVPSDMDERDV
jgi:hypothetical protein